MSQTAYIRLTSRGSSHWGQPAGDEGLLFVDCPGQVPLTELRKAPPVLYRNARVILVRERQASARSGIPGPPRLRQAIAGIESGFTTLRRLALNVPAEPSTVEETLTEVSELVERLKLDCEYGVVEQPVGLEPVIRGNGALDSSHIDRARSTELEALLRLGDGVWTPTDYHYRLPSGEHARGFVRTANAIRTPRDAEVLASWLRRHLRPGLGLILDTGTLSPLVLALQAAAAAASCELGAVQVLEGYPTTERDVATAVVEAARQNAVLALLSVSSTGRVLTWLSAAINARLGTAVSGSSGAIEVLVSKDEVSKHRDREGKVAIDTWHPSPGSSPLVERGRSGDECEICRREALPLVPIRPETFEATFEASITRKSLSLADANTNRDLWERGDETDAIAVHHPPDPAVAHLRAIGTMGVVIDHEKLVANPSFREDVDAALTRQLKGRKVGADLVLIREDEAAYDGVGELVEGLQGLVGKKEIRAFPTDPAAQWDETLRSAVAAADNVLVLTLGAVTGISAQRALIAAQHCRRGRRRKHIRGVIVHARLPDELSWRTLRNSFNRELHWAFQSYLPERSPLQEEHSVLDSLRQDRLQDLSEPAIEFLQRRRRYCQDPQSEPELGLFWGSVPGDRLTPNSLLGEQIRAPSVYVAVASAMEAQRQERDQRVAPEQRVFDLGLILRSYYDPLILSAVLRWLRPREAWWGIELHDSRYLLEELFRRIDNQDFRIVIPELLLAGAQGKVARPGLIAVAAWAELTLERQSNDRSLAPIELGLRLIPSYRVSEHDQLNRARQLLSEVQAAQRAALGVVLATANHEDDSVVDESLAELRRQLKAAEQLFGETEHDGRSTKHQR